MPGPLSPLLSPRSVALIGASANPMKLSHIVLQNLKQGRFTLFPVNPKEKEILGVRCYPSVLDIPGDVDIALISLPAEATPEPLLECVKKGVRIAIVTASGFKEAGPDGAALEALLKNTVRGSKTRLLGPNTMGLFVPRSSLDTSFIPREKSPWPSRGDIALLSQSGAVSVSSLEKARAAGLGISACVGLGNKADLTENDILSLLAEDEDTSTIAMYLESFSDGREFVELTRRITPVKPIVLLKSGRTKSGKEAASSHTGAISSSSEALIDGALAQAGVVRVFDEEELIDTAKAFACLGSIKGNRICVVASAGGYGVIATDLIESVDHGVSMHMARLSDSTRAALRRVVPGFSSVRNPVDLTAGVTDNSYDSVLGILQEDPGIDGIMMSLELQPPNVTQELLRVAEKRSRLKKTPIVISLFAAQDTESMVKSLGESKIAAYPTIWRAVRALAALARRGAYLRRLK